MARKIAQVPNYVRKLQYLHRIGVLPREVGLHMVEVYHDHWCSIYKDQLCNCDPDIRLKCSLPVADN